MRPATFLRTKTRATLGAATAAVILLAATSAARADDPAKILKSMTDYLGGQKSLSASFDSDIEIITPELQKIQFASSGQMKLSRPDKLRVRRTGGYADVELVYDGKAISVYGNNAKSYVQADAPGTVDQMIDAIQARSGVGMPGTDLLLSNAFDELMASDAQLLGRVTYEGFSKAWPTMEGTGEFGEKMNEMPKFVVSTTLESPEWNNTTVLKGDLAEEVGKLKEQFTGDILVAGSAKLAQSLLALDLVDELHLMVFPIVLGAGKRLFADGAETTSLSLIDTKPTGDVVTLTFRRER